MPLQQAEAPAVVCPFYTLDDLCILFGVVPRTIEKWMESGKLPQPVRISRRVRRWWRTEIDALMASWCQPMNGGAA